MNESMGLVGRKIGMTQLFQDDGTVVPVTVVEAGPNTVIQVKSAGGTDGYNAVQLGFGARKESRVNRGELGHYKAAGVSAPPRFVREIRVPEKTASGYQRGQTLGVGDVFQVGNLVDIIGTSKGRGFAGVMKKYHFAGFERSHGTHEYFRHGGSVGTRLTPGMTLAGKRMPGHMGNVRVTVQNMEIVRIDAEKNLLFIRGGVPGPNGAFLTVRKAVRTAH
jgi:large subunit ribosomal protein L3